MPTTGHRNRGHSGYRYSYRPFYITTVPACKNVYDNQSTIDSLNSILSNCNNLKINSDIKCDAKFIKDIEQKLSEEISKAKLITVCNTNTLNTIRY